MRPCGHSFATGMANAAGVRRRPRSRRVRSGGLERLRDRVGQLVPGDDELVDALALEQGLDEAERVFDEVAAAGVDYDDVTETLEEEGVQKFADSFEELLDGIRSKRGEIAAAA